MAAWLDPQGAARYREMPTSATIAAIEEPYANRLLGGLRGRDPARRSNRARWLNLRVVMTHRIHIVGASRSGTTLMHEMMITCFKTHGVTKEEVRLWRYGDRGRAYLADLYKAWWRQMCSSLGIRLGLTRRISSAIPAVSSSSNRQLVSMKLEFIISRIYSTM